MPSVRCPNCGYEQEPGPQCRKCSSLFSYYQQAELRSVGRAGEMAAPAAEQRAPGVFRRVYRMARWVTLGVLVLAVALVLRQSPPPKVRSDPQAVERLQSKLRASQSAATAGQPHDLRLDEAELNSFLSSGLALKRDGVPAAQPPARTPTAPAASADPTLADVQSSVRDVKITMLDDRVQAYVLFDFHGKDLSLLLEGRLRVEDGFLRFEPTSGKLGSLPIPPSTLESAVRRMMASPENREKLRLPADIAGIQIQSSELVVSYR